MSARSGATSRASLVAVRHRVLHGGATLVRPRKTRTPKGCDRASRWLARPSRRSLRASVPSLLSDEIASLLARGKDGVADKARRPRSRHQQHAHVVVERSVVLRDRDLLKLVDERLPAGKHAFLLLERKAGGFLGEVHSRPIGERRQFDDDLGSGGLSRPIGDGENETLMRDDLDEVPVQSIVFPLGKAI
jgi:hypothetical protein